MCLYVCMYIIYVSDPHSRQEENSGYKEFLHSTMYRNIYLDINNDKTMKRNR